MAGESVTTLTLLLIVWSVACLGSALAAAQPPRLERLPPSIGAVLIVWSFGIGLWMIAGFVWRAVG